MHAKYEVSISYGSKVIAKVKVDNRQTDRQDKNNMPPIIRSGGIKIRIYCDTDFVLRYDINSFVYCDISIYCDTPTNHKWYPGADPGIFVRGGGGSNFPKIFDKQKKKEKGGRGGGGRKKTEGCGDPSPAAEVHVLFKSTFQTIIYIQVYFSGRGMVFCTIAGPSLHKHTVFILSGRGFGGLPPENVLLKWCKIV